MPEARYKRVLINLSGEALSGQHRYGIDNPTLTKIAKQIKREVGMGASVAIVGGGNIWRGAQAERDGMERVTADYAGMLATITNALYLQDVIEREGGGGQDAVSHWCQPGRRALYAAASHPSPGKRSGGYLRRGYR